jgi:hypothetical protein
LVMAGTEQGSWAVSDPRRVQERSLPVDAAWLGFARHAWLPTGVAGIVEWRDHADGVTERRGDSHRACKVRARRRRIARWRHRAERAKAVPTRGRGWSSLDAAKLWQFTYCNAVWCCGEQGEAREASREVASFITSSPTARGLPTGCNRAHAAHAEVGLLVRANGADPR